MKPISYIIYIPLAEGQLDVQLQHLRHQLQVQQHQQQRSVITSSGVHVHAVPPKCIDCSFPVQFTQIEKNL